MFSVKIAEVCAGHVGVPQLELLCSSMGQALKQTGSVGDRKAIQ